LSVGGGILPNHTGEVKLPRVALGVWGHKRHGKSPPAGTVATGGKLGGYGRRRPEGPSPPTLRATCSASAEAVAVPMVQWTYRGDGQACRRLS
jgi:hypothetical protein